MEGRNRDVVLVNPRDGAMPYGFYATYENLGIAYLTSALRASGVTVGIVDAYARNMTFEEAAQEIALYSPKLVGFTSTYLSNPEAIRIAEILKRKNPGIHISFGGEHSTYSAEALFKETTVLDSVIFGEGEATIVELAKAILTGKSLESILGIAYRTDGGFIKNPYRPPIADIDSIPFPARDTLDYCVKNGKPGMIGMLASRGCNFNCSFCNANEFFNIGSKPSCRTRSPRNVVDEIEYIYNNYYDKGLYKLIYFYDATFLYPNETSRQWVREICEEIIKRELDVSFEVNCRADSFRGPDDDLLLLLKKAGLKSVFVGLESGSEDVLDKYNKRTSTNQNIIIMEILKKHGIQSTTNGFIMFNPYITLQGIKDSANFLYTVGQCTFWNLSQKVQLFPGIKMVDDLKKEGLLLDTYKHDAVFDYRFKDPRVGVLTDALNFSNEDVPTKENHLVRYVEIMSAQLGYMIASFDDISGEERLRIAKIMGEVEDVRRSISSENRNFVVNSVELMEQNWDEILFLDMKKLYLQNLDQKLEELNNSFEKFIVYVDSIVS